MSRRTQAVLLALLVTFLWSTSFIITKWAFATAVGPLTLAGWRYGMATLCLLAYRTWVLRHPLSSLRPTRHLAVLGLAGYAVNQGGVAVALFFADVMLANIVLAIHNPLQALLWSGFMLKEVPTRLQGVGILLGAAASVGFTYPWVFRGGELWGILGALAAGVGYAYWLAGSRHIAREDRMTSLDLTVVTMGTGALAMLGAALAVEGLPRITPYTFGLLLWMGVVNTAFAFTLWAFTQRTLAAYESSLINNTMLMQTAVLAWLLLGEPLTPWRILCILLATLGIFIVNRGRRR